MRRAGYVSIRELAIFSVMLAVVAAVVAGVSIYRGMIARPKREGIVALSPAVAALLFEIGAGEQVKGVSKFAQLPKGVSREVVGDVMSIDREKILWLQPRYILVEQDIGLDPGSVLARLDREDDIRVERIRLDTLGDIRSSLRRLDQIAAVSGGERVIRRIDRDLDAVRGKVAGFGPAPTVLLTTGRDPAWVMGKGTWLDELVEIAGGRNAVRFAGFQPLNDEQLMNLQPQIIFDLAAELHGAGPAALAKRQESWRSLKKVPAIHANRYYLLTDPTLTIPGPDIGRTAMQFARLIHPDAFTTTQPTSTQAD